MKQHLVVADLPRMAFFLSSYISITSSLYHSSLPTTISRRIRTAITIKAQATCERPSREQFDRIFDAIEKNGKRKAASTTNNNNINNNNTAAEQELRFRNNEMSTAYDSLKNDGSLRLFGSITKDNMPCSGSHTVMPTILEQLTSLSMTSLTPQSSNTVWLVGIVVAVVESIVSDIFGYNLNVIFFVSLTAAIFDQLILNGSVSDTITKILSSDGQQKITKHEAGHFLCSYILGCPVEGYVLSAWEALNDNRFNSRGVSAGTSFFDPNLSIQIEQSKITRSSIDRYSIIVMAGIAAEAMTYGRADGGAGDEQALIAFLSNLNNPASLTPAWNNITIRNQARWGALQAVLITKEYKECYDALVGVMEIGGSLSDCIYAIENAGLVYKKEPLKQSLFVISDQDPEKVIPTISIADTGII